MATENVKFQTTDYQLIHPIHTQVSNIEERILYDDGYVEQKPLSEDENSSKKSMFSKLFAVRDHP